MARTTKRALDRMFDQLAHSVTRIERFAYADGGQSADKTVNPTARRFGPAIVRDAM